MGGVGRRRGRGGEGDYYVCADNKGSKKGGGNDDKGKGNIDKDGGRERKRKKKRRRKNKKNLIPRTFYRIIKIHQKLLINIYREILVIVNHQ